MTSYGVVSRDELIKLYKFGKLDLNISYIIDENDNLRSDLEVILKALPYEDDEDFIVLKFTQNSGSHRHIQVRLEIQNVITIYALSDKALRFYQIKFNPKIRFKLFPFAEIIQNVKEYHELQDMRRGAAILLEQLCGISIESVEDKKGKDFYKKILDALKIDEHLSTPYEDFIFDLVSYKRENKFTKQDVGFIYDMMIIAILKSRDSDKIEKYKQGELRLDGSPSYRKLEDNYQDSLLDYISFLKDSNDENLEKLIDKLGSIENIVIGVVFLKLKTLLDDEDKSGEDGYQQGASLLIEEFGKNFKEEVAVATYLAGLIYAYKKLYDNYYDFLDLAIFKDEQCIKHDNAKNSEELALLQKENLELKQRISNLESAQNIITQKTVKDVNVVKASDSSSSVKKPKSIQKKSTPRSNAKAVSKASLITEDDNAPNT